MKIVAGLFFVVGWVVSTAVSLAVIGFVLWCLWKITEHVISH